MQPTFIMTSPPTTTPAKPYRLFYVSHGQGAEPTSRRVLELVRRQGPATAAKEPAVFIAPGLNNTWGQPDHVF